MRRLLVLLFICSLGACRPDKTAKVRIVTLEGKNDTITIEYRRMLEVDEFHRLCDGQNNHFANNVLRFSILEVLDK